MFKNAQYMTNNFGEVSNIMVDINGVTSFVPIDDMNGDYNEIMRLVAAGEIVIADAN